jgi:polysaccharide export outer membrane protein
MQRIVISALATLILWGCTNPRDYPPITAPTPAVYRLDSGDQLRVIVYDDDRLTGDYAVDDAGTISVPLIGHVQARGMTTAELEKSIKDKLTGTVYVSPSVAVQVQYYRPYFVLGEVNQPGQYPSVGNMTVESAVAAAGGYTYRANIETVTITRRNGDELVKGSASNDVAVQPGDVIYVYDSIF